MKLTRQQVSEALDELGWCFTLGAVQAQVRTGSLVAGAGFAARVAALDGAEGHALLDVRSDQVAITVRTAAADWVLPGDVDLARRISELAATLGLATAATGAPRTPQGIEIGIDALDIPAVLAFWKAVLDYTEQGGNAVVDPLAIGPAVWFQQMDAPRPQRNRLHFDVTVPVAEAPRRISAALAAGGTLLTEEYAPAFWVLADPEGNEACVCTWQGRD